VRRTHIPDRSIDQTFITAKAAAFSIACAAIINYRGCRRPPRPGRRSAVNMRNKLLLSLFVTTASLVAGESGAAASGVLRANPDTLQETLLRARGGSRIVLAPGQYGNLTFPRKTFAPALKIDASQAQFTGILMRGVDGVTIEGGTLVGPREQTAGFAVDSSRHIAIRGMRISGARVGIGVSRSQDILLEHNIFDGARSDGINLAGVQRVKVLYNECRNFDPIKAQYDANGKLVHDGDHPDCIQGWSIAGQPPTSDVTIIGNSGRGFMQGIWFGNSGQGGLDRMLVRDNRFELQAFNGIVLMEARDSEISGNTVSTIPGARMDNYPFKPIFTWVRAPRGERVLICGNTIQEPKYSDDKGPCPTQRNPAAMPHERAQMPPNPGH
jgi:nitrous oxidase accessory protein NosD